MSMTVDGKSGFTMIELLVAMSVFSFMLLIIIVGFLNIVRVHNEALAANFAQDNARTAMDELVRDVRDSSGVIGVPGAGPSGTLCLANSGGADTYFWIKSVNIAGVGIVKSLYKGDGCVAAPANQEAITNSYVDVDNFVADVATTLPSPAKAEIRMTVGVGSSNGTSTGGANAKCNANNADREFCSVVTLTSGAVPR